MERTGRVMVGMSGGVDSLGHGGSLAGRRLGEVVGVTLKLWPQDCVNRAEDKCCGPQAVMDARSVCARLGVPHYLVDESDLFQKKVNRLLRGGIPGRPHAESCVMCNQHLKFGVLLDRATQLGCDHRHRTLRASPA